MEQPVSVYDHSNHVDATQSNWHELFPLSQQLLMMTPPIIHHVNLTIKKVVSRGFRCRRCSLQMDLISCKVSANALVNRIVLAVMHRCSICEDTQIEYQLLESQHIEGINTGRICHHCRLWTDKLIECCNDIFYCGDTCKYSDIIEHCVEFHRPLQ